MLNFDFLLFSFLEENLKTLIQQGEKFILQPHFAYIVKTIRVECRCQKVFSQFSWDNTNKCFCNMPTTLPTT